MPVYTYHCKSCGLQYDQYLNFNDTPPTRCPECGKKTLKKVFQPVGIVFKGSGFYATDHKSSSGQTNNRPVEKKEESKSKDNTTQEKLPTKPDEKKN